MLQIDAYSFEWLKGTGNKERYSPHGAIDNATSSVAALCLTKNECSSGYYSVSEQRIFRLEA